MLKKAFRAWHRKRSDPTAVQTPSASQGRPSAAHVRDEHKPQQNWASDLKILTYLVVSTYNF